MSTRPLIFIGSSTEGLPIAKAIQDGLDDVAEVTMWGQDIFQPSYGYLESLTKAIETVDYAVLVLTPDDITESRGAESSSPRDNVVFELGLVMGHLGRHRCFFVHEKKLPLKLPSDLLGISGATFSKRTDGNLRAALGTVCHAIEARIRQFGLRTRMLKFTSQELQPHSGLPDLSGQWAGFSPEGTTPEQQKSELSIEQRGSFVRATIVRQVKDGKRVFEYEGRFTSGQLVLFFEDMQGRGYIVGTVVLHLSADLRVLTGKSTYFDHALGTVVSAARLYKRQ